ncbi:hypothetical protein ES288_A05G011800v1 [Gossypium darwinii]|uniref:Uncharacterized protein n=1 Tax=Gossypium darwinii TaxID=34276 RepID=A0A5D2GA34_GOSDA|nr:hypothetical protein ES288_A05G011800v1 [Gossypium darwinii]
MQIHRHNHFCETITALMLEMEELSHVIGLMIIDGYGLGEKREWLMKDYQLRRVMLIQRLSRESIRMWYRLIPTNFAVLYFARMGFRALKLKPMMEIGLSCVCHPVLSPSSSEIFLM